MSASVNAAAPIGTRSKATGAVSRKGPARSLNSANRRPSKETRHTAGSSPGWSRGLKAAVPTAAASQAVSASGPARSAATRSTTGCGRRASDQPRPSGVGTGSAPAWPAGSEAHHSEKCGKLRSPAGNRSESRRSRPSTSLMWGGASSARRSSPAPLSRKTQRSTSEPSIGKRSAMVWSNAARSVTVTCRTRPAFGTCSPPVASSIG